MGAVRKINERIVQLNGMVDGGWTVIYCHPIFGHPHWVVGIDEAGSSLPTVIIGHGGSDPIQALDNAEQLLAAAQLMHREHLTAAGAIPVSVLRGARILPGGFILPRTDHAEDNYE